MLNSKVAGLTANKAKKIIEHRNKNGPFINRQQLMEVASIGAKTFEQCAGFLTIRSDAARYETRIRLNRPARNRLREFDSRSFLSPSLSLSHSKLVVRCARQERGSEESRRERQEECAR